MLFHSGLQSFSWNTFPCVSTWPHCTRLRGLGRRSSPPDPHPTLECQLLCPDLSRPCAHPARRFCADHNWPTCRPHAMSHVRLCGPTVPRATPGAQRTCSVSKCWTSTVANNPPHPSNFSTQMCFEKVKLIILLSNVLCARSPQLPLQQAKGAKSPGKVSALRRCFLGRRVEYSPHPHPPRTDPI